MAGPNRILHMKSPLRTTTAVSILVAGFYLAALAAPNDDADQDGILNCADNCPTDFNPTQTDTDHDGIGNACDPANDFDADNDAVSNVNDNCPTDHNMNQLDTDGDGIGNVCDDDDNNPNPDVDSDGIHNALDNCPHEPNGPAAGPNSQLDSDSDGIGDACDNFDNRDVDGDTVGNTQDNCKLVANPAQTDTDADCIGNACDSDDDNDGSPDTADNCPLNANPDQADNDEDGIGNVCDTTPNPPTGSANGAFVIGPRDAVVGQRVTFWSAQWAKANPTTGTAPPSSFCGFANAASSTACGATWKSDPGNSSGPPNTVPDLMTVLVSSSTTKSGSVISGDVTRVVVVRTDPGYGPAPGKTGTGIVTAVVCP